MTSLTYLLSKKIKNRILVALKRPSEIIMGAIFILLIGFTVFEGNHNVSYHEPFYRSIDELYAIILAFYAFTFVMNTKKGFENGATMFSMADVNLIFTSPRKSKNVLVYGLISQMGRSLAVALFIFYPYGLLNETYGADLKFIIAILVGYAVTVFCSQMLAMIIYSLTSKSDSRTKIAKTVFYLIVGLFLAYMVYGIFGKEDMLTATVETANSHIMNFFPVAGFARLGVVAFANGNYALLGVSLGALAVFLIAYFIAVSLINSDYYEDVLKATEVSFSAITARKEGKVSDAAPKKIKIGKTGFTKGLGASAIYEKHKIENRRGKILFLDMGTVVMALITIVFAFIVRNVMAAFVFNLYITIFTVGKGRWAKELLLPYVYLIPEKPFKKLLNTLKEQIPSLIAESIITFVPMMFISYFYLSPYEALAFCVSKFSFSYVCIGVNLIFQRFLGNGGSKTFIVFMYMLAVIIFALPFIVTAFVLMSVFYIPMSISLLCASLMNFVVAAFLIFLSRNVLSVAEYNNK